MGVMYSCLYMYMIVLRWLLPLGSKFFLFETWLQTIVLCSVGYLVYGDKILSSSTGRFHSGEGPNIAYSVTIASLGQKTPENHFFGRSTRSYPIFLDVQHQDSSILAKYQHKL